MKAIGYIRVSTDEQATEGVSLAAQEAKLRAYADLYDLELVEVIADAGQSAKSLKRPGLQTALEGMRDGKAEALVIAKLDRLTRSVADWNILIDGYFSKNYALLSVGDQIDTRTAAGRLVLNVLVSVAQWEREAIGERTATAMAFKKTKGERVGGIPYGYRLAADEVHLEADEAEQEVIAKIHELKAEGLTNNAIANRLNKENVPARGAKWYNVSIGPILKAAA